MLQLKLQTSYCSSRRAIISLIVAVPYALPDSLLATHSGFALFLFGGAGRRPYINPSSSSHLTYGLAEVPGGKLWLWCLHVTTRSFKPTLNTRIVRLCTKCTLRQVADEHHVLLVCPATSGVRARFSQRFRMHTSLQSLIYCNRAAWKDLAEFVGIAFKSYGWVPPT